MMLSDSETNPPGNDEPAEVNWSTAPANGDRRRFVLNRLAALLNVRNRVLQEGSLEEGGPDTALCRRMVDRALYSLYCDCQAAGAGAETSSSLACANAATRGSTMIVSRRIRSFSARHNASSRSA